MGQKVYARRQLKILSDTEYEVDLSTFPCTYSTKVFLSHSSTHKKDLSPKLQPQIDISRLYGRSASKISKDLILVHWRYHGAFFGGEGLLNLLTWMETSIACFFGVGRWIVEANFYGKTGSAPTPKYNIKIHPPLDLKCSYRVFQHLKRLIPQTATTHWYQSFVRSVSIRKWLEIRSLILSGQMRRSLAIHFFFNAEAISVLSRLSMTPRTMLNSPQKRKKQVKNELFR